MVITVSGILGRGDAKRGLSKCGPKGHTQQRLASADSLSSAVSCQSLVSLELG